MEKSPAPFQAIPWVVGAVLGVNVELFTLQRNKRDFHEPQSTANSIHPENNVRNNNQAFSVPTTLLYPLNLCGWARCLPIGLYLETTLS